MGKQGGGGGGGGGSARKKGGAGRTASRRASAHSTGAGQRHAEATDEWQDEWLRRHGAAAASDSSDDDSGRRARDSDGGSDSDGDGGGGGDGGRRRGGAGAGADWGTSRGAYYQDGDDLPSDAEAAEAELAEAKRLQREAADELDEDDFAVGGAQRAASDGEDDEDEDALGRSKASKKSKKADKKMTKKDKDTKRSKKGDSGSSVGGTEEAALLRAVNSELRGIRLEEGDDEEVETINRDLASLPSDEQLLIVQREAPELVSKLNELRTSLVELREFVAPLRARLAAGDLSTENGVSYLEAKYHLLLSYCTNLTFYLLLKTSGQSVAGHAVVDELNKLRVMLERLRPLDKKLRYQLEKLLRKSSGDAGTAGAAVAAGAAPESAGLDAADAAADPLSFKPRASQLVAKGADQTEVSGGTYKAPKMHAASLDDADAGDDDAASMSKAMRRRQRERLNRSEYVQELRSQFTDRPEEVRDELEVRDEAEEEQRKFEEEQMTRLARAKKSARARKAVGDDLAQFDDFGDVVADAEDDLVSRGVLKKRTLKQYLNSIDQATAARGQQSADADLPSRAASALAAQRGLKRRHAADADEDAAATIEPMALAPEHDAYEAAVKRSKEKRTVQAEKLRHKREDHVQFFEDEVDDEAKRAASYKMLKNKGLTPHRTKDKRNPRKHMRNQYEKAVKRRKGQVREVRASRDVYSGEATGIKSNVVHSTKLR